MTPDPLMASAYVSNPQSWNRYSYTFNNPLRFIDPNGEAPMEASLMDYLVNFTAWASPIASQRADSILNDNASGRAMIISPATGVILEQLNFDTTNPFFNPQEVRDSVRIRLVDKELHDLGNGVLAEISMWANLPSTSITDLEKALGHLDSVDDERGEKSRTAKKVGDWVKYVP